jgi:hypothetical protein
MSPQSGFDIKKWLRVGNPPRPLKGVTVSQPLNFETPTSKRPWIFLLVLLASWIGCICTAKAQTSEAPKVDVVDEESTCNAPLQMWNGTQLVTLQIDPDTLAASATYFKRLEDNKAMLFILIRKDCESPWKAVRAIPLTMKPARPKCENTDSSACL